MSPGCASLLRACLSVPYGHPRIVEDHRLGFRLYVRFALPRLLFKNTRPTHEPLYTFISAAQVSAFFGLRHKCLNFRKLHHPGAIVCRRFSRAGCSRSGCTGRPQPQPSRLVPPPGAGCSIPVFSGFLSAVFTSSPFSLSALFSDAIAPTIGCVAILATFNFFVLTFPLCSRYYCLFL